MTPEEAKALKVGDRVLVEAVIFNAPHNGIAGIATDHCQSMGTAISVAAIREVLPRPFEPGDVLVGGAVIIALDADCAFLRSPEGAPMSHELRSVAKLVRL